MTSPAAPKPFGDSSPAISPDGRTLAFVCHLTYDVGDIFLQPLDTMKARRLTFGKRQIPGLAWMPNGKELIFSSNPRQRVSSATGFSAVRDGSVLMWSQLDPSIHDLMLHFR